MFQNPSKDETDYAEYGSDPFECECSDSGNEDNIKQRYRKKKLII